MKATIALDRSDVTRRLRPLPRFWIACLLGILCCGGASNVLGETSAEATRCKNTAASLAPPDSADHRKYAPSREIDILHLALDVTPDFKARTVEGQASLRFKPIAKPFREMRLDAVALVITNVAATVPIQGWQTTDKQLVVTFEQPINPDQEATVTVRYRAQPKRGLFFRTPEMGYKIGDTHLFTQGEAIEARHWYPCFDSPNEKFTSEITCRVPEGMTVVANGKLLSEARDPQTGLVAFRWLQDKPHVNYLVAMAAGYFKKLEGLHRDIPLAFYTPPSAFNEAPASFADTADMMTFFEKDIGVPYPWAKYAQVCVNDFVAGGMENTSLTILTDQTLFPAATENIRSSTGLIAHELAHQWFGDLVTCKDWSHLWLNEGFATYYGHLYEGHQSGRDTLLYNLYNDARGFLDTPNETRSIVDRQFDSPDERFDYLAYPKGGWVLHMLRSQLGDELYRRCIRTYLERHQFGSVVTEDLNAVIEELSGRSFDQFFDQWVYHAHHPELDITYAWEEQTRLAKLTIKQTQTLSDKVLLFNFPLTVRFKAKDETVDRQITVKEKTEDFYFALPQAPEVVRIDPEYTLLAKVKFEPPTSMLHAQLSNKTDVIGRLQAVAALASRKDHESVAKLKDALNQDPFYGVRVEASSALAAIHTPEALEALLASAPQTDARVRARVRGDLRRFYDTSVLAATLGALTSEKNPDVLTHAIAVLELFPSPETRAALLGFLNSDSFQNGLADAAINAMRAQEDPAFIAPMIETLKRREAAFTTGGFANGLRALARLARNEDKKDETREFLVRQTSHLKESVRLAAITALGQLADPKTIPVLETFARVAKDDPARGAAEQALTAVRANKKPADEWHDLRQEVLDLQRENRELKKSLDDLKKRLDQVAPLGLPEKGAPAKPKQKKK